MGTAVDKIDVTVKTNWINISTLFESSYSRYVTFLTVRKEQNRMKQFSGNQSFQKSVGEAIGLRNGGYNYKEFLPKPKSLI